MAICNKQDNGQNGANQADIAVVMVPFVAQGHLNQLLHLSRLISAYEIPVHFVSTTTHSLQVNRCIHGWDPHSDSTIRFHEIQTHFASPPPDPSALTKFPTHLQPSFDATLLLREPVANLLQTLSMTAKKIIVIFDKLMSYVVQDVVTIPNAEAYVFLPLSACITFWSYWERHGRPFEIEPEILANAPPFEGCMSPEFAAFIEIQGNHQNFYAGMILDTSRVIEGKYLDLFAREEISGKAKVWSMGPFNPVKISISRSKCHECLEWLDKQETKTVIYVSFGTTTTLSQEEIDELTIGLEESKQKFLWVLRDADKGDVLSGEVRKLELPKGYEERLKGTGMIIRDWAPQMEILGHPSTGGFMSHCGWNSCLESVTAGVPMVTWPMHCDQPANAVLITKDLKIGLPVRDWDDRNELISSTLIKKVVCRLMNSEEGEEIRRRALELSDAVKRSVAKEGATRAELDSFIAHIKK